ncbi:MAG: cytochrome c biogenesis protein ResB [Candidatus Aminicenantes bacterium]|nr:cytochrome c biogenesis protein ResB [Candidatus Aminicenantes bacterium]
MKFITSLKLTILLIILFIILALLGTLLPQNEEPSFYRAHYGEKANLILTLGLDHLYRSPLFLSVAFLFLLNLFTCSLKNFLSKIKTLQIQSTLLTPTSKEDRLLSEKLNQARPETGLLAELLKKKSFRVKVSEVQNGHLITARKGLVGLFGPEIVHFGLLLIILGGLGSALLSYRNTIALMEGEQSRLEGHDLILRLDRFTTEFYPNGAVRDWKSQVSILEDNQVKTSGTIEVNKPLSYKGLNFYQMSYGYDWDRTRVKLKIKSGNKQIITEIDNGQSKVLNSTGLELKVLSFVPDFQIDNTGQVFSRSAEPVNPAVLLQLEEDKKVIFSGWVFYLHPDFNRFQRKTSEDLQIKFESFNAPQFSVIEAVKDPAASIVWLGCFLLVVGLFSSFYRPYRELKIIKQPNGHYTASSMSRKDRDRFSAEISELAKAINNKMNRSH